MRGFYVTDRDTPVLAETQWTAIPAGTFVEVRAGRGGWLTCVQPLAARVRADVLRRCAHDAAPVEIVMHQHRVGPQVPSRGVVER